MRRKARSIRGRPRGLQHSRLDIRTLEYLNDLSTKHNVNRTSFFDAIVEAWKTGEAMCQELAIKLRIKKDDQAIFLITHNYSVIAQFSIHNRILEDNNPFRVFDYMTPRPNFLHL